MPLAEATLVSAIKRHESRLDTIRAANVKRFTAAWDGLPGYDRKDIVTFRARTARAAAAANSATVAQSTAFYATVLEAPTTAVDRAALTVAPDVEGPFHALWHGLAEGRVWEEALVAGRSQAEASAADMVTSAARLTGDAVAESTGQAVLGWRRVVEPNACPWCQLVAGQLYESAESADFGHSRCFCVAVPVLGDRDPARALNRQRISAD